MSLANQVSKFVFKYNLKQGIWWTWCGCCGFVGHPYKPQSKENTHHDVHNKSLPQRMWVSFSVSRSLQLISIALCVFTSRNTRTHSLTNSRVDFCRHQHCCLPWPRALKSLHACTTIVVIVVAATHMADRWIYQHKVYMYVSIKMWRQATTTNTHTQQSAVRKLIRRTHAQRCFSTFGSNLVVSRACL